MATKTEFIDIYAIVIKLEDYGLLNSIIILSSITMTALNKNEKVIIQIHISLRETLTVFFNVESMLISWIIIANAYQLLVVAVVH